MHAREISGADAEVFLVAERFDLITRALGCRTDVARASLLGVDPKTIYRARRGRFGEDFIARAIAVMRQHPGELEELGIEPAFEAMFDVGPRQAAA